MDGSRLLGAQVRKGICLVIDLSKLNEYIVRPVHLFPLAMAIVLGIEKGAKYFAKHDAVMGYQISNISNRIGYGILLPYHIFDPARPL